MRNIHAAVAQLGPIKRSEPRAPVVARILKLMQQAHDAGCQLVVFPELALTTFFPRWLLSDQEADAFFETDMPSAETQPIFRLAESLQLAFYLGYAEIALLNGRRRHFNTSILVNRRGQIIGKYRKIHIPGHDEYRPQQQLQHLEKRYFEVGDLGFPVWRTQGAVMGMCICNDRRWPETYRVMRLQGAEMILLGYNTPALNPDTPQFSSLQNFHNHLCMQAGAYQNSSWVLGAAKAGCEEGVEQIGGSCIIAPTGEIVTQAASLGDELIDAVCDLDLGVPIRCSTFNFARHRRVEHYGRITSQVDEKAPTGADDVS
jgi:N-carbamoyl-D-amino-acid hydrolase